MMTSSTDSTAKRNKEEGVLRRGLSIFGFLSRGLVFLLGSLWAYGAIYFDGPGARGSRVNIALAIAWALLAVVLLIKAPGRRTRAMTWLACMAVVILPWLLIRPSHDRDWQAEWKETGWAEIEGDLITFHNFRNFDYAMDGTITERWETRTVHLSKLRGLDYFHDAFGGELIAHTLLSYDFGEDGHVVLSIETRRELGESYSEVGGFYKMFELQYLFGDERDLVRVRSNLRNEPVHLYRTKFDSMRVRESFLESVHALNSLHDQPRWYNVVTNNCTTSLRTQTPTRKRAKFDYRMLLNGKLDALVYEKDGFFTDGLSFPELRAQSLINEAANAAHNDPLFSMRIRAGRPGFSKPKTP